MKTKNRISQTEKTELLGNAPIPKALLAMGIPTMAGMLVNAFYNLVDAYFTVWRQRTLRQELLRFAERTFLTRKNALAILPHWLECW